MEKNSREKVLYGFKMRRDVAQEAIETKGRCPMEGDGKGGSKQVHVDAAYADLRDFLGISSNLKFPPYFLPTSVWPSTPQRQSMVGLYSTQLPGFR